MSIAIAALPAMSRDHATEGVTKLKDSLSFSLKLLNFITIPAAVGLIVLARPIIMVLFHRGSFGASDVIAVSSALVFYAVGLWPVAFSRVVTQTFYALKDVRTPVTIAFFTFAINTFLSMWLMTRLDFRGLALSTSISAFFNVTYLLLALRRKIGRIGFRTIAGSLAKSLAASAVMCAVLLLSFGRLIALHAHYGALKLAVLLICALLTGVAAYAITAFVLKVPELNAAIELVKRRLFPLKP